VLFDVSFPRKEFYAGFGVVFLDVFASFFFSSLPLGSW
jgi:hypothetical protein